jgi:NAD(P)H-dependent FMN reductase
VPLFQVVVSSTRPGRVGRAVGEWFAAEATRSGSFDVELLDLLEIGLPMLDEPNHPRLKEYVHGHTLRWSETIGRGDVYAFVMPEYNHGYSAPLKNAVDFLWQEWNDKTAVLVGYGGVSGGTRGMQSFKPVLEAVRLHLASEVPIPFVHEHVTDGAFAPSEASAVAARGAIERAARMHQALLPLRGPG